MSNAINFKPMGNRIVAKRCEPADKIGSIIIPEMSRERLIEGIVVAVGPGLRRPDGSGRISVAVSIGDRVFFGRGATELPSYPGHLVMVEADIMGRVPPEDSTQSGV